MDLVSPPPQSEAAASIGVRSHVLGKLAVYSVEVERAVRLVLQARSDRGGRWRRQDRDKDRCALLSARQVRVGSDGASSPTTNAYMAPMIA